ncbi:MAG TPA: hypothetical protein VLF63_00525 [Patescibacteria group bacterium]|nr:hypothetical protein [Patescibacteria group bacterium]
MQSFIKRYSMPLVIVLVIILGGGIVYALTSVNFANRALSWVNTNCNQKLLNSANDNSHNQLATICFNYLKNGEQDTTLRSLQNSANIALAIYDSNGTKLGPLINHNGHTDITYSNVLNKFVYIADNEYVESSETSSASDSNGIANKVSAIYYQSSDCTGTPYSITYDVDANNVMSWSPSEYYVYHSPEQPTSITANSVITIGANCRQIVQPIPQVWQIYHVNLPFTLPIAEPIQIKP